MIFVTFTASIAQKKRNHAFDDSYITKINCYKMLVGKASGRYPLILMLLIIKVFYDFQDSMGKNIYKTTCYSNDNHDHIAIIGFMGYTIGVIELPRLVRLYSCSF
ncbi:hypothetical protein DAA48_15665 [Aeromonas veronii]|uniref:Uncharacterized protein n=1 Tax=Aeromonas veronii TaxID=654 RepID=A0A2T4MZI3_AERVE|nr:hypothetical protein DAA48_15665 [Aeromonas veronii]